VPGEAAGLCYRILGLKKLCLLQEPVEKEVLGDKKQNSLVLQCLSCALYCQSFSVTGKGKIFKGPSLVFIEQAKRVNLDLKMMN
jgi:hypothetical protein